MNLRCWSGTVFCMSRRSSRAFTLLELVVALVVLGILAALAIPSYDAVLNASRVDTAMSDAISSAKGAVAIAATRAAVPTAADIQQAAADQTGITVLNYTPGSSFATVNYAVVIGNYTENVCVTVANKLFSTPAPC